MTRFYDSDATGNDMGDRDCSQSIGVGLAVHLSQFKTDAQTFVGGGRLADQKYPKPQFWKNSGF
ncbi:hypothetical protein [Tychonema sp. LEGE 07203]|uniref:hypothetical protein n=1 Tax=Tychonema sp. LEGE 07203 TaxID=1828671 RepID=UPI00187EADE7|nr:hypothetical protein [Tychonema sp. LEGE 07203]MBE9093344.1 hypothetical protein [Tychonema sp. LEGE 07203]